MSDPRITYSPRPDSTPEAELDALVAVYKFIIECHESRKVADLTGDPNEVKEVEAIDPEQRLPH